MRMSHQHHVGPVPVDRGDDVGAVGDLPHHADVLDARQDHRQAGADQGVVVDDQHPDGDGHGGHSSLLLLLPS
jgi:hypothetical protein